MPDAFAEMMRASHLAQTARDTASRAYDAAVLCNADEAHQLAQRARREADAARQIVDALPPAIRNNYHTDDATLRILETVQWHLDRIEPLLAECKARADARGSFSESRDLIRGSNGLNRIDFSFALDDRVRCKHVCYVSVFHIEEDATGRTMVPPSRGYRQDFDPLTDRPDDADAVAGHIVDAPLRVLVNTQLVPNTDPCWPSSQLQGRRVTADDSPNFLQPGYTAYFETCVMCFDTKPPAVLGRIRWKYSSGRSGFLPMPYDQNPSHGFMDALTRWLENHPK